MLWVTRRNIRINRTATGWLVCRFIDPGASFRFVEPEEVARIELAEKGLGFDAPGVRYPHQDSAGRCSFEALVETHRPCDPALKALSRIVHRADFPEEVPKPVSRVAGFDVISLLGETRSWEAPVPEAPGLRAIAQGFPLVAGDDHETLERASFMFDALYASLQQRLGP